MTKNNPRRDEPAFPTVEMLLSAIDTLVKGEYKGTWPEDEWFTWSEYWEINLWLDENRRQIATAYPAISGSSRFGCGIRITENGTASSQKS